jgi:hypothetical protein
VHTDLRDRNAWFQPFRDSAGRAKPEAEWDFSHVEHNDYLLGVGSPTSYGCRPSQWQEVPEDSSSNAEMCDFERHLLQTQNAQSTSSLNSDLVDFEHHLLQSQHEVSEEWERVESSPTRFDAIEDDPSWMRS